MRASVIVATRDRPEHLGQCLAALRSQTVDPRQFEIVVVDDGSRPPVTIEPAPRSPEIRLIRLEQSLGPADARNAALPTVDAPVVAITDDDCRPDPGWLQAGLAEIERGYDVVTGSTIPDPEAGESAGAFSYSMNVPGPDPRYSTCNVFYRREVIERVGRFSNTFASGRFHLGEDTDFAWRAIESGARAGFTAGARVIHAVREQTFREHLSSRRRLEGIVPLVKRYPGVKEAYFARYVFSATHLFLLLAIAGTALSPLTSTALLAWAPYAAWRSREKKSLAKQPLRFVARNRALPLWFVADLYELSIFLVASLRHRHLYV